MIRSMPRGGAAPGVSAPLAAAVRAIAARRHRAVRRRPTGTTSSSSPVKATTRFRWSGSAGRARGSSGKRKIGTNPTELVGPHGLSVSPDGRWYYVTTAHGTPNGALWKFSTADDKQAGRVELGRFPATVQVAPNGHYAWVVNFNLYGDMVPVLGVGGLCRPDARGQADPHLRDAARLPALPRRQRHYSACMMNDELVEIDAARMAVARTSCSRRARSTA